MGTHLRRRVQWKLVCPVHAGASEGREGKGKGSFITYLLRYRYRICRYKYGVNKRECMMCFDTVHTVVWVDYWVW